MGFLFGGNTADKINSGSFQDPNRVGNQARLDQRQNDLNGQTVPLATGTTINTGDQDQTRQAQMALIRAEQARVAGTAPSVAETQLRTGADRNVATQMAIAASARGNVNPAFVQRQVMDNAATTGANTNAQAAMLRAQEQQQAEQNLGGTLSGVRGQDLTLATTQAGLNQQTTLANAAAQQAHQQQVNDLVAKYTAMGLSLDQAQFQAQMDLERLKAGAAAGDANRYGQGMGAILQGGSSVGAAALMA